MNLAIKKTFQTIDDLIFHIRSKTPTFYHSSCTSTVIPFQELGSYLDQGTVVGDLSALKGSMELTNEKNLLVRGFISWKEAKEFCQAYQREIMTSPTEELAGVLSGIATSATGERSFGLGNLRSQIISLTYLNYKGEELTLSADKKLDLPFDLSSYQKDFSFYQQFKNAPYPRLLFETDLMTGTEGQLGIITSAVLKTIPSEETNYFFILLPKWEDDFKPHLEIYHAVQKFRDKIFACEFLDSNSLSYLEKEKNPGKNQDVLFFEVKKNDFEYVYQEFLSHLKLIDEEQIFEMDSFKCRDLRMSVPRAIFEINGRMGVTKKGTDVQVASANFENLLLFYRRFTQLGLPYNLFGHFGDAHLHFNFMPTKDQLSLCNLELERLYAEVKLWPGSPFAEHGIGLLKKKFIAPFYGEHQRIVFRELKKMFDPHRQFFREGFMTC